MTGRSLFCGFLWVVFILPSQLFSSPESVHPPESPTRIIKSRILFALRAEKEKIPLLGWGQHQALFKSWRETLKSIPSVPQASPAPYDDLTHEIRTHAQMMIQALQLGRHAKHIEKSIILPGSSFILPSPYPAVDCFMKKHWPTPSLTNMDSLEKALQDLLRKLDPHIPHVPQNDFEVYQNLIKKWALSLTSKGFPRQTQNEIMERARLLYLGHQELYAQIKELTPSSPDTPVIWETLEARILVLGRIQPHCTLRFQKHALKQQLFLLFHSLFFQNETLKNQRNILVRPPLVPPMEDGPAQDEGVDLSSSLDSTLSFS